MTSAVGPSAAHRRYLLQAFALSLATLLGACSSVPPSLEASSAASSPAAWQPHTFPSKRPTRYSPTTEQGRTVVQADADSSVSLYRRRLRVEPAELGTLSFSWMVPALVAEADLSHADSEDAPVRLVLAFEGDRNRLSAKNQMLFELMEAVTGEAPPYATLMYVWDTRAPVDSSITAARTDRIRKIVVDSGESMTSTWRFHERRIAEDFRSAFGEEPGALISVALMTDSDNTRSTVRAYYGEVKLIAPSGSPQ
jgi:hypothetical protein